MFEKDRFDPLWIKYAGTNDFSSFVNRNLMKVNDFSGFVFACCVIDVYFRVLQYNKSVVKFGFFKSINGEYIEYEEIENENEIESHSNGQQFEHFSTKLFITKFEMYFHVQPENFEFSSM